MLVEIITPDQNLFEGEATLASFPGSDGSFGVLEAHAPMVATLKEGKIKLVVDGKDHFFEVNGGVVEVKHNKVIVLAD